MSDVSSGNFSEALAGALGRCDAHGVEMALAAAINTHCGSDSSPSKAIIDSIAAACNDSTRQILDDTMGDTCSSLLLLHCRLRTEAQIPARVRQGLPHSRYYFRAAAASAHGTRHCRVVAKITRKTTMYSTKINLQQNKFNLLREES